MASDSLEDFFSHCPEMLFVADRDGTVRRLSAPLARMLGPEVRPGTKLSARIHPDDLAAFEPAWARIGASVDLVRFNCRILGADGAYWLRSWRLHASPVGGEVHGSLQPRAEGAEQAEILRVIEETVPLSVWATDRQGIFTHHAGKALVTAGIEPGQFLGMNMFEIYEGAVGLKPVEQALAGEMIHAFSQTHGITWENWHIPVRDERGEVVSVVGISLDVSDAKRAEQALKEKLALIERQQQVIRALSTPIIEVWDRILTLPMLGVIDSTRAAQVMESLLAEVSRKGARFAILDLTGVEEVDTATADHLLKIIQALQLLGAQGIITGIRPSVAQTMVLLGMDLAKVTTLATLRNGLQFCIKQMRGGAL